MSSDDLNVEVLDALVIGAGISGISAAYHLQAHCPTQTFKILESRENLGGTWDLFNYPGVRSDSDMYTYGFSFRHWRDSSAIAEKQKILDYLQDTVTEFGLDKNIHFGVSIIKAEWSSGNNRWRLHSADGRAYECRFLFMCTGYYDYQHAYEPAFAGIEKFEGEVVHPQFWPQDFDYANKRVAVIGSGATAVTLVPAIAKQAEHVTMLQRSPTYIGSKPAVDPVANHLSKWLGRWAARWWFILSSMFIYWFSKTFPEKTKATMRDDIESLLGDKFDAKHFTPRYDPWDQRVCLCPDADFFQSIKEGKASVVTDTIDGFDAGGIQLNSGERLDADAIVTATGLKMQFFGGIDFVIDGEPMVANDSYVYKGLMLSNVPNVFMAVGYTNASWTLKIDLAHRYATRLINHMHKHGKKRAVAKAGPEMNDTPLMDLSSGYIQRSLGDLPKQAEHKPWRLNQNYIFDTLALRYTSVADDTMEFS